MESLVFLGSPETSGRGGENKKPFVVSPAVPRSPRDPRKKRDSISTRRNPKTKRRTLSSAPLIANL
jgi:hypothetical protein